MTMTTDQLMVEERTWYSRSNVKVLRRRKVLVASPSSFMFYLYLMLVVLILYVPRDTYHEHESSAQVPPTLRSQDRIYTGNQRSPYCQAVTPYLANMGWVIWGHLSLMWHFPPYWRLWFGVCPIWGDLCPLWGQKCKFYIFSLLFPP